MYRANWPVTGTRHASNSRPESRKAGNMPIAHERKLRLATHMRRIFSTLYSEPSLTGTVPATLDPVGGQRDGAMALNAILAL